MKLGKILIERGIKGSYYNVSLYDSISSEITCKLFTDIVRNTTVSLNRVFITSRNQIITSIHYN